MELYAFAFLRNLATMRFYGLLWRYMDLWKKANLLRFLISFSLFPPINPLISRDFSILTFASGPFRGPLHCHKCFLLPIPFLFSSSVIWTEWYPCQILFFLSLFPYFSFFHKKPQHSTLYYTIAFYLCEYSFSSNLLSMHLIHNLKSAVLLRRFCLA